VIILFPVLEAIGFECQQCGKCCESLGSTLSATKEDFKRWKKEKREDILKYIEPISVRLCPKCKKGVLTEKGLCVTCGIKAKEEILVMDLWIDHVTGEELDKCPFLVKVRNQNKYRCRIQETKPQNCKEFPVYVATKCDKCGLNFVRYFKDTKFKNIPLKQYLKWSFDDFFSRALKDVETCPRCQKPLTKFTFNEWAIENCPATKLFLRAPHKY
jgi:Fe-S-cluster containining protein